MSGGDGGGRDGAAGRRDSRPERWRLGPRGHARAARRPPAVGRAGDDDGAVRCDLAEKGLAVRAREACGALEQQRMRLLEELAGPRIAGRSERVVAGEVDPERILGAVDAATGVEVGDD